MSGILHLFSYIQEEDNLTKNNRAGKSVTRGCAGGNIDCTQKKCVEWQRSVQRTTYDQSGQTVA
jgi:hypothetical protein